MVFRKSGTNEADSVPGSVPPLRAHRSKPSVTITVGRTGRRGAISDEAGQFVGKRAGSVAVVAQEGAKRRPQPRRRCCFNLPSTLKSVPTTTVAAEWRYLNDTLEMGCTASRSLARSGDDEANTVPILLPPSRAQRSKPSETNNRQENWPERSDQRRSRTVRGQAGGERRSRGAASIFPALLSSSDGMGQRTGEDNAETTTMRGWTIRDTRDWPHSLSRNNGDRPVCPRIKPRIKPLRD